MPSPYSAHGGDTSRGRCDVTDRPSLYRQVGSSRDILSRVVAEGDVLSVKVYCLLRKQGRCREMLIKVLRKECSGL